MRILESYPDQTIKPRTIRKLNEFIRDDLLILLASDESESSVFLKKLLWNQEVEWGMNSPLDWNEVIGGLSDEVRASVARVFYTILFNKALRFVPIDELDAFIWDFQEAWWQLNEVSLHTIATRRYWKNFKKANS